MPSITALLHTRNDALRLGRALETLRCCDDVVIVDHDSRDGTVRIAHAYGARVLAAGTVSAADSIDLGDWIFFLEARESLTEGLETTFLEWKRQEVAPHARSFSVFLREETPKGWQKLTSPQTRLVARDFLRWEHTLPIDDPSALVLEGDLLRFSYP